MALAGRVGLAGALAGGLGCASVPPGRSAVDVVDLIGAKEVSAEDVTDRLATAESPKFLGLFRGLVFYDYSVLDPSALQRDLARVERYYRGRGFFEAHARTARAIAVGPDHVRVEIVVDEGPPSLNRRIQIDGLDALPASVADEVRGELASALPPGKRFDEDAYRGAQAALTRALTERGYAYAKVVVDAEADLPAHAVDYTFRAEPGIVARFGDVTIVSVSPEGTTGPLVEIEEAPLRRALHIRAGATYSTAEIDAATQALLDLKVFSSVEVQPQLGDPPAEVVPLVVKVAPTKLRSLRLGGGVEFDELKSEAHVLVGWEDLNFLGGLRDLNINFQPGVVAYPTRVDNLVAPTGAFAEEHLRAQLRERGFLEPRTSFFIQPEINAYPLLVQTKPAADADVVGYFEPKGALGLDRRFGKHFIASVQHNVQTEIPIPYHEALDRTLPTVVLSYPQLITTLDFRDDPVHTHSGFYVSNDLQVAGLGGNARDVRVVPEVRGYLPLGRRVTLAARASVGFLWAFNYGSYVKGLDAEAKRAQENPSTYKPPPDSVENNTDIEVVYFRGLFSGGPGSNRGFPVRGIAPHGQVPFLNPQTAQSQVSISCQPGSMTAGDASCAIPIGGFSLWESSVELRFDVSGPFGVAAFCDAGDVSAQEVDIRLDHLHLSCGGGVRYETPVGPLRLDVGYRVPPLQVIGYANEAALSQALPTEGVQPNTFYVPLAIAFGLGEAF